MIDKIVDAEGLGREICSVGAVISDRDPDTRLQQVDHKEPEQQRDDRGRDEPPHRLGADPADCGSIAHMADADDQGR
jgi:hypothetical protein